VTRAVPRKLLPRDRAAYRYEENGVDARSGLAADGLRLTFTIEYDGCLLGHAARHLRHRIGRRVKEIAPCAHVRAPARRGRAAPPARGMILGGSSRETRSWSSRKRDPEPGAPPVRTTMFVRPQRTRSWIHRGPLSPWGVPRRHFVSIKSGHATNVRFVQRLAAMGEAGSGPRTRIAGPAREKTDWAADQAGHRGDHEIMPQGTLPPHRPDPEPEKTGRGDHDVTINEPVRRTFPGSSDHCPPCSSFEAMAQCGGVLLLNSCTTGGEAGRFNRIDRAKFRKPCGRGQSDRAPSPRWKSRHLQMEGRPSRWRPPCAEAERSPQAL